MKNSLASFINEHAKTLEAAGIDQGKAEIELILCHLLNVGRLELVLHGTERIDETLLVRFNEILQKRETRYPLQYILGECWFYERKFIVTPAVMVPTPETELLCEAAIGFTRTNKYKHIRILDLGVGSGVIAVTVVNELIKIGINVSLIAVDISHDALAIAKKNAENLGGIDKIEFHQSDLFTDLKHETTFDLILSNPPYIAEKDYAGLPPEVLADPKIALTSGLEGLDIITKILNEAPKHLNTGGRIMFEIGHDQSNKIMEMTVDDPRFTSVTVLKDLADIDRIVILACNK
jgi:release factor glutamine methyltransferase